VTPTSSFDDVAVHSAVFGLGAGLTVAPGRLIASFSAKLQLVGRAIALVELFRLSATYLGAPDPVGQRSAGVRRGAHGLARPLDLTERPPPRHCLPVYVLPSASATRRTR